MRSFDRHLLGVTTQLELIGASGNRRASRSKTVPWSWKAGKSLTE